uniref:Uncharacterized protein n=1 Tax=Glossina palpalis gambiensis TaxID=67801 RepID=A0A1B0B3D0_9MUSC
MKLQLRKAVLTSVRSMIKADDVNATAKKKTILFCKFNVTVSFISPLTMAKFKFVGSRPMAKQNNITWMTGKTNMKSITPTLRHMRNKFLVMSALILPDDVNCNQILMVSEIGRDSILDTYFANSLIPFFHIPLFFGTLAWRRRVVRWFHILCLSKGSTPTVGSSKINNSGSCKRATANDTRLCWPPLRFFTRRFEEGRSKKFSKNCRRSSISLVLIAKIQPKYSIVSLMNNSNCFDLNVKDILITFARKLIELNIIGCNVEIRMTQIPALLNFIIHKHKLFYNNYNLVMTLRLLDLD